MPKPSLKKNNSDTIQTIPGVDKGVHAFPHGYTSEIDRNSETGVQTSLLRGCLQSEPLSHETSTVIVR